MRNALLIRAVIALLVACCGLAVYAQGLSDPTRPPAGSRGGAATARAPAEGAGLVLQSVIISESTRSAIISGQRVMLGGRIGPARLIKVSEADVVLLTGDSRRTLKLYPSVQKRAVGEREDREEEP